MFTNVLLKNQWENRVEDVSVGDLFSTSPPPINFNEVSLYMKVVEESLEDGEHSRYIDFATGEEVPEHNISIAEEGLTVFPFEVSTKNGCGLIQLKKIKDYLFSPKELFEINGDVFKMVDLKGLSNFYAFNITEGNLCEINPQSHVEIISAEKYSIVTYI